MKNALVFWLFVWIVVLTFTLDYKTDSIKSQNSQILTNQNSIILLLSKDYPEIQIGKEKE
jgi:hypothetical protein